MTTAQRIAAERERAGLSQRQLADLAGYNCDAVMAWEVGDILPGPTTLARVAVALDLPLFSPDTLEGDDPRPPSPREILIAAGLVVPA